MKIDCTYSRLIPSIFKGTEDEASFIERYLKIFEEIIDGNGSKNEESQINRFDIISGIFHPDFTFLFELFCWDEVPGNDNLRLIKYLSNRFNIDHNKIIKLEKNNDGELINVYYDTLKIELKLDNEKTEVKLKIYGDDSITDRLAAKIKNGKLYIYSLKNKDFLPSLEEEHEQKFNNYLSAGINEFLVWFAQWMGLAIKANWDIETKRKLIAKIILLYRMRGTKAGLEEYLKICTGYDIEIIDEMKSFQVGIISTVGIDTMIGGLLPNNFIVNIKVPSDRGINRIVLEELINNEKPVHTTFKLNINYI